MLILKTDDIWKQEHLSGLWRFAHIESMGNPPVFSSENSVGQENPGVNCFMSALFWLNPSNMCAKKTDLVLHSSSLILGVG